MWRYLHCCKCLHFLQKKKSSLDLLTNGDWKLMSFIEYMNVQREIYPLFQKHSDSYRNFENNKVSSMHPKVIQLQAMTATREICTEALR